MPDDRPDRTAVVQHDDGCRASTDRGHTIRGRNVVERCFNKLKRWRGSGCTAAACPRSSTGFALQNRDGHDVATLTVDGAPKPIDTVDDPYAKPPVVTEAVRQAFQPPKAVPAKMTPATSATVTGTWVPATGAMATNPHATFAADGSWTGTDGCNGGGGRWAIDAGGRFLTTASSSTAIGCDGAPIPAMVTATTRMAFDGATLVLLGRDGHEEGRLARG